VPLRRASIVGGSGYSGGELLRLLLGHPQVKVAQVTSRSQAGKPVTRAHPNLRGQTSLKFSELGSLEPCDILFLCLPHGEGMGSWERFEPLAPRIIDLSADYRLAVEAMYRRYYGGQHPRPELLRAFTYGLA